MSGRPRSRTTRSGWSSRERRPGRSGRRRRSSTSWPSARSPIARVCRRVRVVLDQQDPHRAAPRARRPSSGRRRGPPRRAGCRPAPRPARGPRPGRARPRRRRACRPAAGTARTSGPGPSAGTPGPWSTTRRRTRGPARRAGDLDRAVGVPQRVADQVGQHPLEQAGVGRRHRQRRSRRAPGSRSGQVLEQRGSTTSLERHRRSARAATAPVCSRLMSSRSADHRGQPGGRTVSTASSSSARSARRQSARRGVRRVSAAGAQAGERRAQVVGDGGEQRRTGAVAGLELARGRGLPGQLLALARARRGGRRRRRARAARPGPSVRAAQHQHGVARTRRPTASPAATAAPSADAARRPRPPKVSRTRSSSPGDVVLAGEHGAVEHRQRVRLGLARRWPACRRRAAESTTDATATETSTKTTSVSDVDGRWRCRGCAPAR